jgi:type II secretory pathway component HofQ
MRIAAAFFALAVFATPALAQANRDEDPRAADEAFAQKLLEIIEKTAAQADEQALDRTDTGGLSTDDEQAAKRIEDRLDSQRLSINFDDTPISEAIDFLRDATSVNVVLSKKAKDLTDNAPKLKLRLKDVKVRNALELVLTQTDPQLRYGVRNGVLEIGTTEDWQARNLVLDVIEVSDLVTRPPDFPAPEAGLQALESKFRK